MSDYTTVTKTSAIREGRGKAFTVNGRRVAIFNEGGEFCAVDNTCPHAMGSLGRGGYGTVSLCVLSTAMHTIQKQVNAKPTHASASGRIRWLSKVRRLRLR